MTAPTTTLAGTWTVDPAHSTVGFTVRHLMVSKVRGSFTEFGGSIVVAEDGTPTVTAEVTVGSVHTGNEQRDAHLAAPDFFDVAQFPTATFASTGLRRAESGGDGDFLLSGDLTIKGVTRTVELPLRFLGTNPGMGRGEVAGFEASTTIDRKDFGITFDAPLETGGVVVGNEVTLTLEIEALKQA